MPLTELNSLINGQLPLLNPHPKSWCGLFFGLGAVEARGSPGGLVVFWDNRVLVIRDGGGEWDDFLAELGDIRGLWGDPWCIRGDFNIIIYPRETRNCFRLSATMQRFSEIEELKLMRGSFT
ncbi:hypothetical protein CK203_100064 [Vitis vinifera]|uniref:Uncharacterized protein n=1 Tax=Vitis vinifera TaxID=29760 RepID=A0A438DU46_VITVI|nr:hypothetical protein CK203_100064 [Vitis vinifera]